MKIAFLNLYQGINNRGAESFASDLAKGLSQNHDVVFFIGGTGEKTPPYKTVVISSFVAQPKSKFNSNLFQNMRKRLFLDNSSIAVLMFSIKTFPDLWKGKFQVLSPINGFWQIIICKFVQLFRGGRIIVRGDSGPGWDERWNLLLSPNIFIATTPQTQDWAQKVAPWVSIRLIPLAIDTKKFKNVAPAKLELEHPIILCPSAADTYKRVDLAIKAVSLLKSGSLLHVGGGEQKEQVAALGSEILGPKRFKSIVVPKEQMPAVYNAASVVTLPSTPQESFGIVLLEAMASQKTVVATDSPKTRWILGATGVFVDPTDISSYSEKINESLKKKNDPGSFENQISKFDLNAVTRQYETLLK